MKRRRVQREERRRRLVEMNLSGEGRNRSPVSARGCASLLGRIVEVALIALTLTLGLR